MKVKTLGIYKKDPFYKITSGHNKYERSHWDSGGTKTIPTGNGWATTKRSTQLFLTCLIDGIGNVSIRIDNDFRQEGWDRLSEKRINAIENTMPSEVSVEPRQGQSSVFYTLSRESVRKWFENAKQHLNR